MESILGCLLAYPQLECIASVPCMFAKTKECTDGYLVESAPACHPILPLLHVVIHPSVEPRCQRHRNEGREGDRDGEDVVVLSAVVNKKHRYRSYSSPPLVPLPFIAPPSPPIIAISDDFTPHSGIGRGEGKVETLATIVIYNFSFPFHLLLVQYDHFSQDEAATKSNMQ
jgi:hypothetical protein